MGPARERAKRKMEMVGVIGATGHGRGDMATAARASETGGDTGRGRDPEPGPSPGPGPGQGAARGAETSQDRGGETENVERMEKRGASIVIAGRIVTI